MGRKGKPQPGYWRQCSPLDGIRTVIKHHEVNHPTIPRNCRCSQGVMDLMHQCLRACTTPGITWTEILEQLASLQSAMDPMFVRDEVRKDPFASTNAAMDKHVGQDLADEKTVNQEHAGDLAIRSEL